VKRKSAEDMYSFIESIQYNTILHLFVKQPPNSRPETMSIVQLQRRWMEKSAYRTKKDKGESKRKVLRPDLEAARYGI